MKSLDMLGNGTQHVVEYKDLEFCYDVGLSENHALKG